jgi:ArsR family transcriptional regulator, arsenate/arsenite/antimonite-responsive transcriptional repressor
MKDTEFIKAAKALADRNRLKIVKALSTKGSMTCAEAMKLTGLSQPTTSHNVKILAESGLVETERDGKCTILSLNKSKMKEVAALVGAIV